MLPLVAACILFIGHNLLREAMRRPVGKKTGLKTDTSSKLLVIYIATVLLSPLLKLTGWFSFTGWLQWSGIGLMLIGLTVHTMAMKTLHRHYTGNLQTIEKHQLITSGIYGIVRHPGYLGNLSLGIGFGLASGSWAALAVILIVYAVAYCYRIKMEEAMLATTFGEQYRTYAHRTHKLIPFVY